MKLSTKGRYAMVALADIALQPEGALVTLGDIVETRGYLAALSRAAVCQAAPGRAGGHRCAAPGAVTGWREPASEIRVVDVLAAVDETVDAMHKGAGAIGRLVRHHGRNR